MRKGLSMVSLVFLLCLPAFAGELPASVKVSTPKELQVQLDGIEDAAIQGGASKKAVYGSTSKLANFIEDSVLSTGRTVILHPRTILQTLVQLASEGNGKAEIGGTLVQLQKSSKL